MKNNKAFTLIELLVVISIIGVLSSIVFVSFSGSRDKAKLAKAQNFDAQVSHALGAYAVGIWRFEEGSGIDIHDESGFGNDGTFYGNPTPVFPDGVYAGTTALQFDGTDDYVDCGNGSSLNIIDAITIEAWVKRASTGTTHAIITKAGALYSVWINSDDRLEWYFPNASKAVTGALFWDTDKWYHVVFLTTDGTNAGVKIYRDGVGQSVAATGSGSIDTSARQLKIGVYYDWSNHSKYFNGSIDNVAIYDEALSYSQIQQHYAAGAASHGITLK